MDLSKLKLNKEILNVVWNNAKPEASGVYKEFNETLPWKKVFLSSHAYERFLKRTRLSEKDASKIDVSRFILDNRGNKYFKQFNNEKENKTIGDKLLILRVSFGEIPFEIVLADKGDNYVAITLYFDLTNNIINKRTLEIFEKEKADKEFNQMLIDNFFGSQQAKDEFDKMSTAAKEAKVKEIYKSKAGTKGLTYHNFKDILEDKKREFKNIRVDREVKDEFNIRREVKKDVVVVSASDFKEDLNWQPEFSDIDLDIESDFEDEE